MPPTRLLEPVRTAAPRAAEAPDLHGAPDRRGPLRPSALSPSRVRLPGGLITRVLQVLDTAAVAAASCAVWRMDDLGALGGLAAAVSALFVITALTVARAYAFRSRRTLVEHLVRVSAAFGLGAAGACVVLLIFAPPALLALALQAWTPLSWGLLIGLHAVWWGLVRRWRAQGRLTPNLVVVGATGSARRLIAAMLQRRDANILGVFDDRAGRSPPDLLGVPVLGDTEALLAHPILPHVDRIVISVPSEARDRVAQLIERLRLLPNAVSLLIDDARPGDEARAIDRIADIPLAHISGPPSDQGAALVKRIQDLVIGTVALIAAAPIMAVIAVAIRLDSPGPALFRQRRHGFVNEEITVYKFRSMRVESADARATRQVSKDDDRVTRVGRFIRRTSLDELPQIFNVLMGQMSLVGPRPHAIGMMTGGVESARLVAEYAHRHRVKPGMTGWAAIHGSRGPVDTPEAVERRVALDVEYIDRQSLWLDLYIMAVTIPCLLGDSDAVR